MTRDIGIRFINDDYIRSLFGMNEEQLTAEWNHWVRASRQAEAMKKMILGFDQLQKLAALDCSRSVDGGEKT